MSTDTPLELQVVVSPAVDVAIGGTFSPTSATIVTGPAGCVLAARLSADPDELIGMEARKVGGAAVDEMRVS